jgi:hypothetical protein
MSKIKQVVTLTDALKATKKLPRTLVPQASGAPSLGALDDLIQYERLAGAADAKLAAQGEGVAKATAEIDAQRAADAAKTREDRIYNPKTEVVDYSAQAQSPEEFKRRLVDQLEDPSYASRASTPDQLPDLHDEIAVRLVKDQAFQEDIIGRFKKQPRFEARMNALTQESAYGNRVFVNIARQSDPTRSGTSMIQFEHPHEFGLHSGTNVAAQQATIRDPDIASQSLQAIDEMIGDVAMGAGMSEKQARALLFDAVEDFFNVQFTEGRSMAAHVAWSDVSDTLRARFEANGFPGAEANQIIARLKQMPTASSTPHFFLGKNGLLLNDLNGNFRPDEVGRQLQDIFNDVDDYDEIQAAMSGPRAEATKKMQAFLESKGYDHIVYHNAAEDRGTLSIINWNEDLFLPLLDERLVGDAPRQAAQTAASYVLGSLGVGNAALQSKE